MPQRLLSLRTTATACVLAAGLALVGCGGSDSSGPSREISGTYRINGASNHVGRFSATMAVSQSGSEVTGNYQNDRGQTARLRGSVSGTHLGGQLIATNAPVLCSFESDFFPDGTAGSGSYSCDNGETGRFTTVRV
jgi:hypothetical protein